MYDGMKIYKAQVVSSSALTGTVYVRIPSLLGATESIAVSRLNATDSTTPAEGTKVLVAVEDASMSNVYLVSELGGSTSPTAAQAGGEEFSFFLGDL